MEAKIDQLYFALQVPQLIPFIWVELFKEKLKTDYYITIIFKLI